MGNITQKWVEVLVPFSKNYLGKMTGSSISRETGVPQQTLSRILNTLVKENIVCYSRSGKNKEFYLNLEGESFNLVLNLVECQKSLIFLKKNSRLRIIINELSTYSDSLIIFGSYASGKQKKDSDLDVVCFDVKDREGFNKKKREFPIQINPHFVSYDEFDNLLKQKSPLALEIKGNHLLFGDISKLVRIFKDG